MVGGVEGGGEGRTGCGFLQAAGRVTAQGQPTAEFGAPVSRPGQEASENEQKKTINLVRRLGIGREGGGAGWWCQAVWTVALVTGGSGLAHTAASHVKGHGGRRVLVAALVVIVVVLLMILVLVVALMLVFLEVVLVDW